MVMVKLKMKAIYKSFLSLIGFLIVLAGILGTMYLFYDKVIESDSDVEVSGDLSINYITGKKVNVDKSVKIKFSVTNSGDSINYYNISFLRVRGKGYYKLFYNDNLVSEGTLKSIDEITADYMSIDAGETKLYVLEIFNSESAPLQTELNVRTQEGKILTFSDVILQNETPAEDTLTDVGEEVATEDEGLIKSSDDIGVSYYFRGNVNNNYVLFGDMLWRIVRINGDGTVRMVLDGVTDTIAKYYTADNMSFDFGKSNMINYLESWMNNNLGDYLDYIANTKYCNDIVRDEVYNYNSYTRIMTNKIPTLNCLGNSFNNNVGLLTIDEVVLAGANATSFNKSFYLYNSKITTMWYTMSGAKGSSSAMNLFMVDTNGTIKTDVEGNLYRNVRPVINLIKNIEVDGIGTSDNPYRIKQKID